MATNKASEKKTYKLKILPDGSLSGDDVAMNAVATFFACHPEKDLQFSSVFCG